MVLTDERLAQIVNNIGPMGHGCGMCLTFDDCPAEYQPGCDDCILRSREGAAMLAELIEARAILRELVSEERGHDVGPHGETWDECIFCGAGPCTPFPHADDCLWVRAKRLVEGA